MTEKNLVPNRDAMVQHINLLFEGHTEGLVEIAISQPDSSAVNRAELFKLSEIERAVNFAVSQNSKAGVNVYVGAALRKPGTYPMARTRLEDYYSAPYAWCDLDDEQSAKMARERYGEHAPSVVVVTGRFPNLRAQLWWKLNEPCNDDTALKPVLGSLCSHFEGDASVVDPIRVMRLAGSLAHPKKDGRVLELTELIMPDKRTEKISLSDLQGYFPAVAKPVDKAASSGEVGQPPKLNVNNKSLSVGFVKEDFTVEQVCDMLSHIHPDGEYLEWLKVGMALKAHGVGFDVFDSWSQQGSKYPGSRELQYKWNSFKGTGTGIGTVYYLAEQRGYHPSKYKEQAVIFKQPEAQKAVVTETKHDADGVVIEEKRFLLLYADDVVPVTETTDFVEDLLCENQFSVVYGESNCGKTFFMLDLAMHVALGMEWRGKDVKQGGVIYAALEGGHGTKNRICAFKEHYKVTKAIPLAVIPSSINFLDADGDVQTLINSIRAAQERLGHVLLIVIDTLARAISGGDENSSIDMGKLVAIADHIRAITGAHIVFIHHSGKDTAKGARGHSSLRAAVDTEIEISRPDTNSPSLIKVVKQREMEMSEDMAFILERVTLGTNQRGKDVTSCIVKPSEVLEQVRLVSLNPVQTFVFEALIEAMIRDGKDRNIYPGQPPIRCVSYDDLRLVMEERGYKEMMATEKKTTAEQIKSATQTARLGLKKAQRVNFDKGFIWPVYVQENENK